MVKNPPCQAGDPGSIPGSGRSPREGNGNPVFLPGEFHEQRTLVGCSPWGRKESDTTEQLNNNSIHSSIIYSSQKVQATYMSHQWTKKYVVCTYIVCVILRRSVILTQATMWVNLKDIVLDEISQTRQDKYCMIPLRWDTESSQIHRNRSKLEVIRTWRGESVGRYCLLHTAFQFGVMIKFWRWVVIIPLDCTLASG